jgi:hypothetical protein
MTFVSDAPQIPTRQPHNAHSRQHCRTYLWLRRFHAFQTNAVSVT